MQRVVKYIFLFLSVYVVGVLLKNYGTVLLNGTYVKPQSEIEHLFSSTSDTVASLTAVNAATAEKPLNGRYPEPEDRNLGYVAGTVFYSKPKDNKSPTAFAKTALKPAKGVTVALYEANPEYLVGKNNGQLSHLFGSFETTENGNYYIKFRKAGAYSQRYLAFMCNGKLVDLWMFKAYENLEMPLVTVDCSETAKYKDPPPILGYINQQGRLSCDMVAEDNGGEQLTYDVSYRGDPRTTATFAVEVEGFDPRFTPSTKFDGLVGLISGGSGFKGAWRKEDCLAHAEGNFKNLCFTGTPAEYEEALTTLGAVADNRYLTANFLPTLPPESLLAYKEFTTRMDSTYAQNPMAIPKFIRDYFGDSVGKYSYRLDGRAGGAYIADCAEYKKGKRVIDFSNTSKDYKNLQATAGIGQTMAPYSALQKEYEVADKSQVVCKVGPRCTAASPEAPLSGSDCRTLGDIQPDWVYCAVGTPGCDYKLDKSYFSGVSVVLNGPKNSTGSVPLRLSSTNDSVNLGGSSRVGDTLLPNVRDKPFTTADEGYRPDATGERVIFSGPNVTDRTGQTSLVGALRIASSDISGSEDDVVFASILDPPHFDDKKKASSVLNGDRLLVHVGESNFEHCMYSSNNGIDFKTVTKNNENSIYKGNLFTGNLDHYNDLEGVSNPTTPPNPLDGSATATTGTFITSAAKARSDAGKSLWSSDKLRAISMFFFDGILSASYGTGKVVVKQDLVTIGRTLFNVLMAGGDMKNNTFFDIKHGLGNLDLVDHLIVTYPLTSTQTVADFYNVFRTPTSGFQPADWGGEGDCNLESGTESCCYPWGNGKGSPDEIALGDKCNSATETVTVRDRGGSMQTVQVSPTCGVSECQQYTVKHVIEWTCDEVGGHVIDEDEYYEYDYNGSCDEWDRVTCARDQRTTIDDINTRCAEGNNNCDEDFFEGLVSGVTTPSCRASELKCIGGECYGSDSKTVVYPACQVKLAGPYGSQGREEYCGGKLVKDPDLQIAQKKYDDEAVLPNMNSLVAADNSFAAYFDRYINKGSTKTTYSVGAAVSSCTSVTKDANCTQNKAKDIPFGVGGAAGTAFAGLFAPPLGLSTETYEIDKDAKYHCTYPGLDINGGRAGGWSCRVVPVPSPEVIDIKDLDVNPSCALNLSPQCFSALGLSGDEELSETFATIVGAAGSRFGMPASVIVTYMAAIRRIEDPNYKASWLKDGAEALEKSSMQWGSSVGNQIFASCNDMDITAIGPLDWRKTYFLMALADGGSEALNDLASGRGDEEVASRCNFLDASYTASAAMSTRAGCNSWSWSMARDQILIMLLGTREDSNGNPVAPDPSVDGRFADNGPMHKIFNACR